jgi:hypothetical protein
MNRTCPATGWPLERALFAIAGTVTLLSAALAAAVSPWFLLLTAFVGVTSGFSWSLGPVLSPSCSRVSAGCAPLSMR